MELGPAESSRWLITGGGRPVRVAIVVALVIGMVVGCSSTAGRLQKSRLAYLRGEFQSAGDGLRQAGATSIGERSDPPRFGHDAVVVRRR